MKRTGFPAVRCTLALLALSSSAHAVDYTFLLNGQRTELKVVEHGGKVFVEANRFGKYLGPVLDRVIDTGTLVSAVTSKVDVGPLNGLLGGLMNRAASEAKYEVIRRAEEPYVDIHAFARGQGAQLVYHPFDKTFVIGKDAAGLARGEEARFQPLGSARVRLDDARLNAGGLALRFAIQGADEAAAQGWTFVGDGAVLSAGVTGAAGQYDVALGLRDGAIPKELTVHDPSGSRVTYDLGSLR